MTCHFSFGNTLPLFGVVNVEVFGEISVTVLYKTTSKNVVMLETTCEK